MNMTPHPLQDPSVSASAPKSESGLAWTGAAVVGLAVMSLVFLLAGFVMTVRRRKA